MYRMNILILISFLFFHAPLIASSSQLPPHREIMCDATSSTTPLNGCSDPEKRKKEEPLLGSSMLWRREDRACQEREEDCKGHEKHKERERKREKEKERKREGEKKRKIKRDREREREWKSGQKGATPDRSHSCLFFFSISFSFFLLLLLLLLSLFLLFRSLTHHHHHLAMLFLLYIYIFFLSPLQQIVDDDPRELDAKHHGVIVAVARPHYKGPVSAAG